VTDVPYRSIEGARFFEDARGTIMMESEDKRFTARYGGFHQLGFDNDVTDWQNPQRMRHSGRDATTPVDVTGDSSFGNVVDNNQNSNLKVSITITSDGTQTIAVGFQIGGSDGGDDTTVAFERLPSGDMSGETKVSIGPFEVPPDGSYIIIQGGVNDANITSVTEWRTKGY
jgi:hypothetical protein